MQITSIINKDHLLFPYSVAITIKMMSCAGETKVATGKQSEGLSVWLH